MLKYSFRLSLALQKVLLHKRCVLCNSLECSKIDAILLCNWWLLMQREKLGFS